MPKIMGLPKTKYLITWAVALTVFCCWTSFAQAADLNAVPPGERLVSNVFMDTFITEALSDIALQAQVNIIPDASVQGYVTLELKDVPLEEALRLVLYPGGYVYRYVDGAYLVGSKDPSTPLFSELSTAEMVYLNYIKADDAKRLVGDFYTRYARFDPSTNTAFVTGTPDIVARFKRDIALVDQPPAQLVIEVLITELSNEARKALGLDISATRDPSVEQSGMTGYLETEMSNGIFNFALSQAANLLRAKITALAGEGKVTVKANPRVMVMSGSSAEIFIGKDRYYRIVTSTASTGQDNGTRLESIDVGVSLAISPKVAKDGTVTLRVEPTVSDVSGMVMGEGLPIITRRQAATSVRVADGETVALGGLIQQVQQSGGSRVPILSDLPVLRNLFGTSYTNSEETEVVIFLTPHLVK